MTGARTTRIVYFSWVREMIGSEADEIDLPDHVKTVDDLIHFLRDYGDTHRAAMEHDKVIRFAIDEEVAERSDPIGTPREIAVFPPMTGG